jgi:hypothetical protein
MSFFQRKPVSDSQAAGKASPRGQDDLDRRINWSGMRDTTTVNYETSPKPQTMAPFWDVGKTRGVQDTRHNKGAPTENYWGKQFAAPARSQYSRSFNDNTPTLQRRYDSGAVSGIANVQLINPVATTSRKRIVLYDAAGYLWAVVPRIPGQTRDNFGGFHMRGIDPQSYAAMVARGPGSNPVNPGGPGKIAGRSYVNPMHTGVGGIMNTSYGGSSLCL